MMGTKERSFAPLIQVSLENLVPADHLVLPLDMVDNSIGLSRPISGPFL